MIQEWPVTKGCHSAISNFLGPPFSLCLSRSLWSWNLISHPRPFQIWCPLGGTGDGSLKEAQRTGSKERRVRPSQWRRGSPSSSSPSFGDTVALISGLLDRSYFLNIYLHGEGIRSRHPEICHFGKRMILSWRHLSSESFICLKAESPPENSTVINPFPGNASFFWRHIQTLSWTIYLPSIFPSGLFSKKIICFSMRALLPLLSPQG